MATDLFLLPWLRCLPEKNRKEYSCFQLPAYLRGCLSVSQNVSNLDRKINGNHWAEKPMYRFWTVKLLRFVPLFFIFSVAIAIYFYPGGNIHDPEQVGYSVTHNFLSDLGGYQSRSGSGNLPSAIFFNFSVTAWSLSKTFFMTSQLLIPDRLGFPL